jgi:hypothetical protein
LEAIIRSKPSFTWCNIHGALPIVKKGLFWRIGNGQTTQIWGDKWIPKPSTYMVHSPTTFLPREAKVGELIDNQTSWWNQTLLESMFMVEEKKAINTIPISSTNQSD